MADLVRTLAVDERELGVYRVSEERWEGRRIAHRRRPNHVLLLITGGRGTVVIDDGAPQIIGRGWALLLAPSVPNEVIASTAMPMRVRRVAWTGPGAASAVTTRLGTVSGAWQVAHFARLVARHRELLAATAGGPLRDEACRHLLHLLLVELAQDLIARGGIAPRHAPLVSKAADWLETHHRRRITVGDAARAVGVSAAHLSRRFSAERGETPQDFLRRLRARAVIDDLHDGARPLAELAERFGYSGSAAFAKAVARWCGRSVREIQAGAARAGQLEDE